LILVIVGLAYVGWLVFGPATAFSSQNKSLYIHSGKADRASVIETLSSGEYINHVSVFDQLAGRMGVWEKIRPGRYEIPEGASLLQVLRILKNAHQTPIRLVLTKVRTKEELASALGNLFECDSASVMQFMENPDSTNLFGLDTSDIMTSVIPNTYLIYWDCTPGQLFHRFYQEQTHFWTPLRRSEASAQGLTPVQAYILASIVEEETHKESDKPLIASVYLNRLRKGMRLQADPTIKFAMGDFSLKEIYFVYLKFQSPYNTYINSGLPPGPICTPAIKTIDAVLEAPRTDYLYFVAKADLSGYSVFTSDYKTQMINAKAFHDATEGPKKR